MRRTARAALANRDALLEILRRLLPPRGTVLELGSGTGEHAVHFARHLPHLAWQPSDPDPEARASIEAWAAEARLPNLRPSLHLDLRVATWWGQQADALLCVNVLHLAPPEAQEGLLAGAERVLPVAGPLVVVGPFRSGAGPLTGRLADLDRRLRAVDGRLGVRDADDLSRAAVSHGLEPADRVPMPGGDLLLAFRRERGAIVRGHFPPGPVR
jgi:SAM-dependent methyltransferase